MMSLGRNVALLILVLLQLGCNKPQPPLTIRLAGDEWFLKSLVKTGMIAVYEQKTGVQVEVLNRNDRTIMKDLDQGKAGYDVVVMRHRLLGALIQKHQVQPIDPPSQQQLFP